MDFQKKINEIFFVFNQHPTIKKIDGLYHNFSTSKIKEAISAGSNERLRNHIFSLYDHALDLRYSRGIREKDWIDIVIAIVYHDIAKIFLKDEQSLSWQEKKILGDKSHHSLCVMRLFLSVNDRVLSHSVRHNSSDFAYDIASRNVLVSQLVLNLVDKSDISGKRVSVFEKYEHIRKKIGNNIGYDDDSERMICVFLEKILSENRNLYDYEFIREDLPKKENIAIIQRFDNKYCIPVGKYEDTNSNVKISRIISDWGFRVLLMNNGEGFYKYNENLYLIGLPEGINDKMIPMYCYDKQVIIIEGTTHRFSELKKYFGKYKKVVLLLRTLASGTIEKNRLDNLDCIDEIWVMTDSMKNIIESKFLEQGRLLPDIKILQSGYNPNVFFPPDKSERINGKIVYVGALTKIKGVDILIEAFKRVKKKFPYIELHLIGDENIYGSINDFNKSLYENVDGIISHGVLDELGVSGHLRSAHFSCLLTQIYETFGKSAMQARVCGTRMIVSNQGNLPFHVQDEKEGLVISEVSVESVEVAMEKLLAEPAISFLPPQDRYNYWLHTALDFFSYTVLLTRKTISG